MRRVETLTVAAAVLAVVLPLANADTEYYRHVLFDNSLTPDRYYYSEGRVSAPSTLTLDHQKLPVENHVFKTGPNALVLEWQSMPRGGWTVEVGVPKWRNRELLFPGDVLSFWLYSATALKSDQLPRLALSDTLAGF